MPTHTVSTMFTHSPAIARGRIILAKAQFGSIALEARDREVVTLTVASLCDCEYEWVQHEAPAQAAGVSAEARAAIKCKDFESTDLAPRDSLVARFASETIAHPRVGERLFAEVREMFSPRQIVEMVQITGFYFALARFCTGLDIEIDEPHGLTSIQAVAGLAASSSSPPTSNKV
jgi:AhpD family alkylhydroperoxidase